jgi:hypothetical protein
MCQSDSKKRICGHGGDKPHHITCSLVFALGLASRVECFVRNFELGVVRWYGTDYQLRFWGGKIPERTSRALGCI